MKRRLIVAAALCALALSVGAAFAARWAFRTREASLPPLPKSAVPTAWHDYRNAPGHVVHVDREGIACNKCHVTENGFQPPSMQVCATCHEARASIRHAVSILPPGQITSLADCMACHGFGPEQRERRETCIRCHELQQGRLSPITQHAQADCTTCHKPHRAASTQPADCLSCHQTSQNHHGKDPADSARNCMSCHQAHQPAVGATDRCTACHDKPHALSPQAHASCTGCHKPHSFERAEVSACRSCHQKQHVLGEQRSAAHADCKSCHDPHAPTAVSESTCMSCHTSIALTHPAQAGRTCLGCHRVHDTGGPLPSAQPCTGCHQQAHVDRGPTGPHAGHAACTDCHKPHAFAHPATPGNCSSCHAAQLSATSVNRGHAAAACKGCHAGDVHAAENPANPCVSCHMQVHTRVEHAECTSCHEPHSGAPSSVDVSCKKCHDAAQHALAPAHSACLTCHTPHAGTRPAEQQCTHCHSVKAQQNHAQLKGGCISCHTLHTPNSALSTPACTSCHEPSRLPGLHRTAAHAECNKCHSGAHAQGPFSARATCVSCHAAQQNHVPEARLCQGCHVFRE